MYLILIQTRPLHEFASLSQVIDCPHNGQHRRTPANHQQRTQHFLSKLRDRPDQEAAQEALHDQYIELPLMKIARHVRTTGAWAASQHHATLHVLDPQSPLWLPGCGIAVEDYCRNHLIHARY